MAAGTRITLQLFLVKGFRLFSFQLPDYDSPALLFIVTASPSQDWVICRLLPSLNVVAVSQAPSPEPNPDSPPSPVANMVGHYHGCNTLFRPSSPSFGSQQARSYSNSPAAWLGIFRLYVLPKRKGLPPQQAAKCLPPLLLRPSGLPPKDSHACCTPWSVFHDRSDAIRMPTTSARGVTQLPAGK